MSFKNIYSDRQRQIANMKVAEDPDNPLSHDCAKQVEINYAEWTKMLSYYRYYVDRFATDVLKIQLFPFQKFILRAMTRYPNVVMAMCRGRLLCPTI